MTRSPSEHVRTLDRVLVLLAFTSVVVFLADRAFALVGREAGALLALDIGLAATYVALFAAKAATAAEPARWLRRHAWLLPATIPLTVPLLAEPWFLLVQVAVLVLRMGKAVDHIVHAHVLEGLATRYTAMIVERATEPVLMALANALEESVTSRDYAAAVARRLDERRHLVDEAVRRAIEQSPRLSRLTAFAPVRRLVEEATEEVVTVARGVLAAPETNRLLQDALREACAELKAGIAKEKWPQKGVGLHDVWHGVVRTAEPARVP